MRIGVHNSDAIVWSSNGFIAAKMWAAQLQIAAIWNKFNVISNLYIRRVSFGEIERNLFGKCHGHNGFDLWGFSDKDIDFYCLVMSPHNFF